MRIVRGKDSDLRKESEAPQDPGTTDEDEKKENEEEMRLGRSANWGSLQSGAGGVPSWHRLPMASEACVSFPT